MTVSNHYLHPNPHDYPHKHPSPFRIFHLISSDFATFKLFMIVENDLIKPFIVYFKENMKALQLVSLHWRFQLSNYGTQLTDFRQDLFHFYFVFLPQSPNILQVSGAGICPVLGWDVGLISISMACVADYCWSEKERDQLQTNCRNAFVCTMTLTCCQALVLIAGIFLFVP